MPAGWIYFDRLAKTKANKEEQSNYISIRFIQEN
jgi:hypothetical protein